jgi:hypothetical protein
MPTNKFFDADGHMIKISWGRGRPGIIIGAAQSETPDSPGWFVEIGDREVVNQVIRTIRRARDSAFGRDQ